MTSQALDQRGTHVLMTQHANLECPWDAHACSRGASVQVRATSTVTPWMPGGHLRVHSLLKGSLPSVDRFPSCGQQ